jgi:hypothetical protein
MRHPADVLDLEQVKDGTSRLAGGGMALEEELGRRDAPTGER